MKDCLSIFVKFKDNLDSDTIPSNNWGYTYTCTRFFSRNQLIKYQLSTSNVPVKYQLSTSEVPVKYQLSTSEVPVMYQLSTSNVPVKYQ